MKRNPLVILSFLFFCVFGTTLAYAPEDLSNANYLADQSVVMKQINISKYRLDDTILRQEVIGMALKIKGVTLPENYICKKYFTDAQSNDWVCRALEIAADNGIISRTNKQARPLDTITRAEALAILLKTEKISLSEPRRIKQTDGSVWSLYQDLKKQGFTQWQADMLDSLPNCSLMNHGNSCEDGAATNKVFAQFQPNEVVLRASVFEYAALMMGFRAVDDTSGGVLDDFNILVNTAFRVEEIDTHKLSPTALKALLLGQPIERTSKTPEVILVVFSDFECSFCTRYFQDVIGPLFQDTTQSLALVYKQFPLSFHAHAYDWALESECVNKNLGDIDFFKYIHARYASPDESVYTLAPKLTEKQMKACLTDIELSQKITDDQNLGVQYKVSGTPTTLIINAKNGYYETVVGAQLKETVEATIKAVKEHQ